VSDAERLRKHPRRIWILTGLGVLLTLGLLPGTAVAAPGANGLFWTYRGSRPGWEQTARFTYHDSSSLQYAALEVDNSTPATYQWSKITVRVNGVPVSSITAFPLTGTIGGIGLEFSSGLVTDGTKVSVSSDANPTIPKNAGGGFFLQDVDNQGMFFTLNGPIPAKTIGRPYIWADHLSGVRNGKPILEFVASRGSYAPDLSSLSVLEGIDLTYYISGAAPVSALLRCTAKKAHHELTCKAKRPVSGAKVRIAYPHLTVSKSLERAVTLGRITKVPFQFTFKDTQGHKTSERVKITIGR
jgi:hypothetical protein